MQKECEKVNERVIVRYVIRCSFGTEWYIGEMKRWIPAFAESTPQNAPRMGIKCSGGE